MNTCPLLPEKFGARIVGFATDEAVHLVVFALSGELWTVSVADRLVQRLPAADAVVDPRQVPTGERIAYVSDGAVRVISTTMWCRRMPSR